jgi:hypothetical protein
MMVAGPKAEVVVAVLDGIVSSTSSTTPNNFHR